MRLFLFLLLLPLTSFSQKLIILHTNDHHGSYLPNQEGEYGLAAQSTMVKKIREEAKKSGAHVLLLSAGDFNTGAPESNLFKAKPDILAMNAIGYDAAVLGNHEFDNPLSTVREQEKIARFKILGSNIKTPSGDYAFTPYITREVDGKKIAIVGFNNPDTVTLTPAKNRGDLVFQDPFEASSPLVQKLRKNHDVVIGLSHLGYYPGETHGIEFPGDETLAKRIPELDFIFGGHTHSVLERPVQIGQTYIAQAGDGGKFLGKMEIDLTSGKPVMTGYELISLKGVPKDPHIVALTQPFVEEAKSKLSVVIAKTTSEFQGGRPFLEADERPLGKLIASAQKAATDADVVFLQPRGIRSNLPAGNVTLQDILEIHPFGSTITTATLNGTEFWQAVEAMYENHNLQNQMSYFSPGLEVTVQDKKITGISLNGKPIPRAPTGQYKLGMNSFLSEVSGIFTSFRAHPSYQNTGITDAEALRTYLSEKKVIGPEAYAHKSFGSNPCKDALTNLLNEIKK